jgi:hypothetical protein
MNGGGHGWMNHAHAVRLPRQLRLRSRCAQVPQLFKVADIHEDRVWVFEQVIHQGAKPWRPPVGGEQEGRTRIERLPGLERWHEHRFSTDIGHLVVTLFDGVECGKPPGNSWKALDELENLASLER